jgi:hypothetical protein
MADRRARSDSKGDAPGRRSPPGTPRWVKGLGIVAVVAVALVVILHLTGLVGMGGHH